MKAIEVTGSITEEWSLTAIVASIRKYLDGPEEDIYTLEDGEPIEDEVKNRKSLV